MVELKDNRLDDISGGGIEWVGIGLGISALIVFIAGVIEGYTNPGRCGVSNG